jgi:hypothetical protein
MRHRKLMLILGAALAFGMALASQPTARKADLAVGAGPRIQRWVPGTDIPMSVFEARDSTFAAPR